VESKTTIGGFMKKDDAFDKGWELANQLQDSLDKIEEQYGYDAYMDAYIAATMNVLALALRLAGPEYFKTFIKDEMVEIEKEEKEL
jgi:hypothetical protein